MGLEKFIKLTNYDRNLIAQKIQYNISEEALAAKDYLELKNIICSEDEGIIDEIISDELDHAIILGKLQEKYSRNFPGEFQPLIQLRKKKDI